jgi:hypothetical protein
MGSKHLTSSVAKKFRIQPSAARIMRTLFWSMEDTILVHFTQSMKSSDFHIFGPMKETLRRRRFSSDEEVSGAVQNWLKTEKKKKKKSDGI